LRILTLMVLLACGSRGRRDNDSDTGSADLGVEADITEVLGDCDGTYEAPDMYPNQLLEGDDLHLALLTDSQARCNDGSPPAVYIRRADSGFEDRWVLHLQGGGECSSYDDCRDRWCGQQGVYDASKMSSTFLPDAIKGVGIFEDSTRNSFASYNHVWVYYCSSDEWEGTNLSPIVDPSGAGEAFSIYRQGHGIVDAALDALDAGVTSDDGAETLPSLADAAEVLWTGTSAGSHGAQIHADAVTARFGSGVDVTAIFDASVHPHPDTLPADALAALTAYLDSRDEWKESVGQGRYADTSCEAAEDAAACDRASTTMYGYIDTPFLTRMDLYDSVALSAYRETGLSDVAFAEAVIASQEMLADLAVPTLPGAYSQACGQHVGIESSAWTYEATLTTSGGAKSMADAWVTWLAGDAVAWLDDTTGSNSSCAELDDDH
jgi:Pectinacetylesterase